MFLFRPFRNTDPPALCDVWSAEPATHRLAAPVTPAILDQTVLAKPYFDRQGLIVALADDRPVGFVHAGFGPSEDRKSIDPRDGAICMLMVRAEHRGSSLAADLLARAEAYLIERGTQRIYAMGSPPVTPFYAGFYGGSTVPGVLESDTWRLECFRAAGYQPAGHALVLQRSLADYRPPVSREMMQLRRRWDVKVQYDPPPSSWWDACLTGFLESIRFRLSAKNGDPPPAVASFWNVEPLASCSGTSMAGLLDVHVDPPMRETGLGTYLLGSALLQLQSIGIAEVAAEVNEDNSAAHMLLTGLDFQRIDRAVVMTKSTAKEPAK